MRANKLLVDIAAATLVESSTGNQFSLTEQPSRYTASIMLPANGTTRGAAPPLRGVASLNFRLDSPFWVMAVHGYVQKQGLSSILASLAAIVTEYRMQYTKKKIALGTLLPPWQGKPSNCKIHWPLNKIKKIHDAAPIAIENELLNYVYRKPPSISLEIPFNFYKSLPFNL